MKGVRQIAIVGNPNSGKTTIFNALTGSSQQVGNWPGVTVEYVLGSMHAKKNAYQIVDLPGIYSFNAHSEDQRISRDYLMSGKASLIVDVVDASNLERNLYLTQQLRELGLPVLVVLNMWDLASKRGTRIDIEGLARTLGCPVVAICGHQKSDIRLLKEQIAELDHARNPEPLLALPDHPEFMRNFRLLCKHLGDKPFYMVPQGLALSPQWVALKCLEGDEGLFSLLEVGNRMTRPEFEGIRKAIVDTGDSPEILIAEERFRKIQEELVRNVQGGTPDDPLTTRLDKVLLHRFLGFPLFLLAMYLVFWFTINIGGAFIDFFDILFGALLVDGVHALVDPLGLSSALGVILADGIGAGVQSLSTFIPVIFSLFFMLSLLEDSGYMARAAFVMDRFMRLLGLPGKAFVPLLVGFGCSVPAFMGTRTLEQRKDRILTSLMVPFMSCGAKMPVYALFAVAFFPNAGQNIIFLLYLVGIFVAVATGLLLKHTVLGGKTSPLVMELPSYHVPRLTNMTRHAWLRLKDFIVKGGKVLVPIMAVLGILNAVSLDGRFGEVEEGDTVLAAMGKTVTPIFTPFGIEEENWPASVSLFTGFFAKEVVVGTLSGLYAQSAAQDAVAKTDEESWSLFASVGDAFATVPENLRGALQSITDPLGLASATADAGENSTFAAMRKGFGTGQWGAFAFLLFVLLYVPCMAATATMAKELGWAVTSFMVFYSTALAWIAATLTFQLSVGHDPVWVLAALGMLAAIVMGLRTWSKKSP